MSGPGRGLVAVVLCLVAVLAAASPAGAQGTAAVSTPGGVTTTDSTGGLTIPTAPSDPNALSRPDRLEGTPAGHRLTGAKARDIAATSDKVEEALRDHPTAKPEVFLKGPSQWQVSWFTPGTGDARKEVAQVIVDDATGGIVEAWNGPQVAWTMARGYPGAFGRKVNSPWVWIPLSILFVAPFLTPRRPLRWLHLDLLVLVGFGVSVAYFNDANLDVSVPLIAPLLAYLVARMLWIGLRRRDRDRDPTPERGDVAEPELGRLPLLVPVTWLAIAVVFLVGFRVGLNLTSSNVIDVGYSGVIGADRLVDGTQVYGHFPKDDEHGDTYGPVAYEAYVPFEQALPWSGRWDDLPAAHAASIAFDLLTLVLLFFVGRRIRGPGLGIVLAYAWATWPFSLYALSCNTNDALVAMLAALLLLVAARPAARGVVAALAGLTKLGALGLVPLTISHAAPRGRWLRTVAVATAAFAVTAVVVSLPVLLRGESLSTIYDRTIGFQASRGAPFSIWGLYDLRAPQHVWQVLAAVLALAVAFVPRRRDVIGLAALSGAVVIALQLGVTYWFYLYLVWFFPFVAVALFARYRVPDPR
ncbi:MAG TPA: hypothetical protein VFT50_08385 [Baekduia sp.]|nr:hypothetical protein [Baekduia sp.]